MVGWTYLAAVIGFDFVITTDEFDPSLDLGQLIDQRFGIGWHIFVQAILPGLCADERIAHDQATHAERGQLHVSTLDLRLSVSTILEAREQWGLLIHLLDPFVERLDLDMWMSLCVHVHAETLTLGRILIAHH